MMLHREGLEYPQIPLPILPELKGLLTTNSRMTSLLKEQGIDTVMTKVMKMTPGLAGTSSKPAGIMHG